MLLGLIRLLHTFHQVPRNMMEDRGRSSFQAPSLSAKSRPAGTFLLRRLRCYFESLRPLRSNLDVDRVEDSSSLWDDGDLCCPKELVAKTSYIGRGR